MWPRLLSASCAPAGREELTTTVAFLDGSAHSDVRSTASRPRAARCDPTKPSADLRTRENVVHVLLNHDFVTIR
jgi:hypothetical protein